MRQGEVVADALRADGEPRWRAAVVAGGPAVLEAPLLALAQGRPHPGVARGRPLPSPKVGFLLSGLGRERADAGAGLIGEDEAFTAEVAARLSGVGSAELATLRVSQERWLDPHLGKVLLGALQLGLAAALARRDVLPAAVCGYSIGEYAAASLAGAYTGEEAMRLLWDAGASTAAHAVEGGMLLVRGSAAAVERALVEVPEAWLSAQNAAERVVVSGGPEGLESAAVVLDQAELAHRRLSVSSPIHCPLMAPVAADLLGSASAVGRRSTERPLFSTATGQRVEVLSPGHWSALVVSPARFLSAWECCRAAPVDLWVELGPAPSLSLVARADRPTLSALDPALPDAVAFARLLGWLWCHGVPSLEAEVQPERPPLEPVSEAALEALLRPPQGDALPDLDGCDERERVERLLPPVRRALEGLLPPEGLRALTPDGSLVAAGLDSLAAVSLGDRLAESLGRAPALRALLEAPSLRSLAQAMSEALDVEEAGEDDLAPLPRGELVELPASPNQRRLARLHAMLAPATYNTHLALRVEAALDPGRLQRALQDLSERHEQLRVALVERGDALVQRVLPEVQHQVTAHDLRGVSSEALEALRRAHAQAPFALDEPPLLRLDLVRLGPEESALLLTWHHAVTDGQSVGLFLQELSARYTALGHAAPPGLPPTPSYARYAQLRREAAPASLAWWRAELDGLEPLDLPTDRPRLGPASDEGAELSFHLGPALSDQVDALARGLELTPFVVLLTAWVALLHRLTGATDFPIALITSGRTHPSLREVIGFFVRTLPMRCALDPEADARALARALHARRLGVMEHQEAPLEELLRGVQPALRSRLLDVSFVLESGDWLEPHFDGAPTRRISPSVSGDVEGTAKFDLSLALMPSPEGYQVSLQYRSALFDEATARRWAGHLEVLLAGIVEDPTRPISELPLLSEAERRRLLVEWNDTAAPEPEGPLHAPFEQQVQRTPDATALVFEGATLSYAALNARANQLAWHLRGLGVGPEVRVGIHLERSVEVVVAILAALKAGGAYVPLDPSYPEARLRFMAEDAGLAALITSSGLALPTDVPRVELDLIDLSENPSSAPGVELSPEGLAYVIYTSGSTGRPKGVAVPHRGPRSACVAEQEMAQLRAGTVTLHHASFAFDASVVQLFSGLSVGARLVLASERERADVEALTERSRSEAVEVADLPPALLPLLDLERLGALRVLIVGGEASSPGEAARVAEGRRLINCYGPTEASVDSTYWEWRPDHDPSAPLPIGRPLPNTRLYVLDRGGQLAPVGVPGELYIAGVGLARGYLGRPGLTAERFLPDPFGPPGSRMYRTGDLCRWREDGELDFLGRVDQQVQLRGYRVELGEIEAAVSALPEVSQCAAVVSKGASGERLVAYVVGGASLRSASLRASLQSTLPAWMLPSAFVQLDALPLTPNGKVDREALPAPERHASRRAILPPVTPSEVRLAKLWRAVLGVAEVGLQDRFFELGGDSIAAARVAGLAKREGLALSVRDLFTYPELGQLARRLDQDPPLPPARCLVELRAGDGGPPLIVVSAMGGSTHAYQPLARALEPGLSLWGLEAPEVAGRPESPDDIPGLASLYAEELQEALPPEVPVRLLGYSFGGPVAVELARQLREAGRRVQGLLLLDPSPPAFGDSAPPRGRPLGFLCRQVGLHDDEVEGLDLDGLIPLLVERMLGQDTAHAGREWEEELRRLDAAARRNRARSRGWRAAAPGVSVTLLRTEQNEGAQTEWGALLGEALQVKPMPGDHFNSMLASNAAAVAAQVGAWLETLR